MDMDSASVTAFLSLLWSIVQISLQDGCNENCHMCIEDICFQCKDEWLGSDCSVSCKKHCQYGECNTADCVHGCTQGWYGKACKTPCFHCLYGCDRYFCKSAPQDDEESKKPTPRQVWATIFQVAGGIVAALVLCCVICYCCSKRQTESDDDQNDAELSVNGDSSFNRSRHQAMYHQCHTTPVDRSPYGGRHLMGDNSSYAGGRHGRSTHQNRSPYGSHCDITEPDSNTAWVPDPNTAFVPDPKKTSAPPAPSGDIPPPSYHSLFPT